MPFKLETLLLFGGLLHFAVFLVSVSIPRVLNWRVELSALTPLMRQLVWVYGIFITLVIVGFGTLSIQHADAMVSGTPLARAICGLIAIFWTARLVVQFFVYDVESLLKRLSLKLGYYGLTAVFIYLSVVYGFAAIFATLK